MTTPAAKNPRADWCGVYDLLRNGRAMATITLTRAWNASGPRHTATLDDGRYATHADAGYAMHQALRLVANGETVWPWFDGCVECGLTIRARGKAPWGVVRSETGACCRIGEREEKR